MTTYAPTSTPPPEMAIIFSALGDATRRDIFERVAATPQSVGELAVALPVSRPAVSQHLRVLKDARLVSVRTDGNRRIYRMDPRGVEHLRVYLDHFWNLSLAAFKTAVEQPKEKR
ncbi:MAG: metalloregulator ArsR/SmtB family transcription factor [Solirubrobacteraceae bacterium]